jgi:hypothetical protein
MQPDRKFGDPGHPKPKTITTKDKQRIETEKTMKRQNAENYKMLTRVADFAANHVGLFPKTSAESEVRSSLETVVGELAELASTRISAETAVRSSWTARKAARVALKGLLMQANSTARALGVDKFRLPHKPTDHGLIDVGRAFMADIEPLKKDFIKHGLSPDEVTAAVDALDRAILDYTGWKAKRSAAIREFDEKLETAMGYMRRFEALVANTQADNPAVNAEWTVARTIPRVAVRKRQAKPPEPVVPVAPPAVQPLAA